MSISHLFKPTPNEKIIAILRRHPLVLLKHFVFFLLMAGLPAVGYYVFFGLTGPNIENPVLRAGAVLLAATYYLGVWVFMFSQFTDYYLDMTIVTDDRILDFEQKGLFDRMTSELNLSRIQDVHSEVKGIIQTIFNYGMVDVQTAGEEAVFKFEQVPNPHGVRQKILELSAVDRKKEAAELFVEAEKGQGL